MIFSSACCWQESARSCQHELILALLAAIGAAYGTAKAGIGISGMGTLRPELIMKVRSLHASHSSIFRVYRVDL